MISLKSRMKNYGRIAILMLVDLAVLTAAVTIALLLLDWVPEPTKDIVFNYVVFDLVFVLCYYAFGMYRKAWRFANSSDYIRVVCVGVLSGFLCLAVLYFAGSGNLRAEFIASMLAVLGTLTVRFLYKMLRTYLAEKHRHLKKNAGRNMRRIMIVGAGHSGAEIVRELKNGEGYGNPVALIDDNPNKHGIKIDAVPVVGGRDAIPRACSKYKIDEIIIAIPSGNRKDLREIVSICQKTHCKVRTLPPFRELINNEVKVSLVRDVDAAELLGRDEVSLNQDEVAAFIQDEVVLVTGGGGSIGSEICRQVMRFKPKKLLVFDIYENSAYDLQGELSRTYGQDCCLEVLIGSVRDKNRLREVFEAYHPSIVFHAAAHKHVPLMETSPHEAIKNNVYGTKNAAECAHEYGAKSFVLISTDKAVNPTSMMGASKRVAEMIVQLMSRKSKTKFSAVRFGNVLGSNGSVIPLFKQQIKAGGPVTVTDAEMVRFFMTIPEAAQLVLQSAAFAGGGEIYVLDMGEPVKIYDMAKELIRLSGYEPEKDIQIVFTGLRPGEKMYEELLKNPDTQDKTAHEMIFVEKARAEDLQIHQEIQKLKESVESNGQILDEAEEVLESIS